MWPLAAVVLLNNTKTPGAAQATQTSVALVVAQPADTNKATGWGPDHMLFLLAVLELFAKYEISLIFIYVGT